MTSLHPSTPPRTRQARSSSRSRPRATTGRCPRPSCPPTRRGPPSSTPSGRASRRCTRYVREVKERWTYTPLSVRPYTHDLVRSFVPNTSKQKPQHGTCLCPDTHTVSFVRSFQHKHHHKTHARHPQRELTFRFKASRRSMTSPICFGLLGCAATAGRLTQKGHGNVNDFLVCMWVYIQSATCLYRVDPSVRRWG